MPTKINLNKTTSADENAIILHNKTQEMERSIREFFLILDVANNEFDVNAAFNYLFTYRLTHDRILYSTISNIIYAYEDAKDSVNKADRILVNVDKLLNFSFQEDNIQKMKENFDEIEAKRAIEAAQRSVLKIWDHVSLAHHQYTMLKQTDEEYDLKFKTRIASFKEELSKELNSQLITMVGIFTALAFLIFGSISSLDGIFENNAIPLFRVTIIGLIWGICVLNMIFVFLFCIGKMTNLNFKSNRDPKASIFQRYPVVWWSNYTLIVLLLLAFWGYFLQKSDVAPTIVSYCNNNAMITFGIGSFVVFLLSVCGMRWLVGKCKS